MSFFFRYARDRLLWILLFLLCIMVFLAAFALYHLPMEAVLYPTILSCLLLTAFTAWDCYKRWKQHQVFCKLQAQIEHGLEVLSSYRTQEDEDYRMLIQRLYEIIRKEQTLAMEKESKMINYYTIWVHQIKTPIASMRLILQNEDSARSRELSGELLRIEQYVEMVLCYLRLDSQTKDYVFREYAVDDMIRSALRRYAGQFIRCGIHLNYTPTKETVITDEKWLTFVLEQILSNALKYTPSGSITIWQDSSHRLCIRDTGIGIAPEDLPRIFEYGYTGYNGRTDQKASGLGLYLCKRICDHLGHPLSIESIPKKGTTVKIDLFQHLASE